MPKRTDVLIVFLLVCVVAMSLYGLYKTKSSGGGDSSIDFYAPSKAKPKPLVLNVDLTKLPNLQQSVMAKFNEKCDFDAAWAKKLELLYQMFNNPSQASAIFTSLMNKEKSKGASSPLMWNLTEQSRQNVYKSAALAGLISAGIRNAQLRNLVVDYFRAIINEMTSGACEKASLSAAEAERLNAAVNEVTQKSKAEIDALRAQSDANKAAAEKASLAAAQAQAQAAAAQAQAQATAANLAAAQKAAREAAEAKAAAEKEAAEAKAQAAKEAAQAQQAQQANLRRRSVRRRFP